MSLLGQSFVEVEDRQAEPGPGGVFAWGNSSVPGRFADREKGFLGRRIGRVFSPQAVESGEENLAFLSRRPAGQHPAVCRVEPPGVVLASGECPFRQRPAQLQHT